jgi:Flp pilus assembly protein TadG
MRTFHHTRRTDRTENGAAILEAAIAMPILLLVAVSVFEFGHAFQTWQVLTNAAREGARIAVLAGTTDTAVTTRVRDYLTAGAVANGQTAAVVVTRNVTITGTAGPATTVSVTCPFEFMVLQPVAQMIVSGGALGSPIALHAVATMRNEAS